MPPTDHVTGNPATVLMLDEALYATRPPDIDVYAQQFTALVTGYPNAAAYANAIVNSGFGTLSDSALATLVLGNMINPDYGGNTPALNAAVTAALAANPANRGAVVLQLGQLLDSLVGDATYGPAAAQWRAKIAGDYAQLTYNVRNFVLTNGVDALIGYNASDDTFVGTESTLQAGDNLDGRGGLDTLRVGVTSPQPMQFSGFTAINMEQLLVTSDAVGGARISAAGMPDTTTLINDNSSTSVGFNDVGRLTTLRLQNVIGGDTSVAFAPAMVAGNNDQLNVVLSNNKTIAGGSIGGISANGIEVMNLSANAGSSMLAEVASPGSLAVLNISGDQDVSIAQVNFFGPGNSGGINASQFHGKLSIGVGPQGGADLTLYVIGGQRVDTLRLPGAHTDYTLRMAGAKEVTDTLLNSHASSAQSGIISLVNVERVQFTDGALALDMHSGQSGYKAVQMLGAVLGSAADKAGAGALLAYFDTGGTLAGAAQLVLDTGYLAGKAGTTTANTAALVSYVYANVNGQAPLPATLDALLAPITSHTTTLAQWIATMAASTENMAHVQLTGYGQTGLAYV